MCAVEKDNDTIITGSRDDRLKEWNTTSYQSLRTVNVYSEVYALTKTRNGERVLCGLLDGSIEVRNTDGLGLIFVVNTHAREVVFCIRELEDGSFVSTSCDKTMKRWNDKGEVLQVFSGHVNSVLTATQMTSDTIVSSGDRTLKLWKLSTGECLSTIKAHVESIPGLFKLSKDKIVSASTDKTIRVWDVRCDVIQFSHDTLTILISNRGGCIETIRTGYSVQAMIRLRNGSIVTVSPTLLEVRQLK